MATSISVKDVVTDILDSGNVPMTLSQANGITSGGSPLTLHDTSDTDYVVPAGKVFQLCYVSIVGDGDVIWKLMDSTSVDTTGTLIMPRTFYIHSSDEWKTQYVACYHAVAAAHNLVFETSTSQNGDSFCSVVGYERDA